MNNSIFDSLKSQSNYALAVSVVSGTILMSSLTANAFEFLAILTLCLSSLLLLSYALGIQFYLRKSRADLADVRVDTVMEKHTSFSLVKVCAITLFFIAVMVFRTHHSLTPEYANVIFSVAIVCYCVAMANSSALNIFKVLLINHKVITNSRPSHHL